MQGLRKSKRVTWASDVNLCQVRLFLSEESPAQVGHGAPDYLQEKSSWISHSGSIGSDDNLPPGFEGIQPISVLRNKLAHIPVIKWRCPFRFELDPNWRVVAGEESNEVDAQNQREMRVLEAIYPRPSAIPPNPCALLGPEESFHIDELTPVIPITPIEEEDPAPDNAYAANGSMNLQPQLITPTASSSQGTFNSIAPAQEMAASQISPGMESQLVAAAQAALAAAMSTNDQGNLIDRDLLLRILSDPQMIEQLVRNHGESSSKQHVPAVSTPSVPVVSTPSMPNPRSAGRNLVDRPPQPISRIEPPSTQVTRPEHVAPSITATSDVSMFAQSRVGTLPNSRAPVPIASVPSAASAPAPKDINYYKSLIQQHGGEKQDGLPQFSGGSSHPIGLPQVSVNNSNKPRDSKPKIMKPCMFFNTARGCRNGTHCPFQHDSAPQPRASTIPDVQNAKRMKMDREISGS